jgi:putative methanogenesis marker 16 metalloprotein
MNGAEGFVTGTGTRSSRERPNLSGFADMHKMVAEQMGGFVTSAGPECICSWALPIPVISKTILAEIARPDADIVLPVNDINTRAVIGQADYADVWTDVDLEVEFEPERCSGCLNCRVEEACPMRAVKSDEHGPRRDEALCFHCGLCATLCPSEAFRCRLGAIRLKSGACGIKTVPVVLRQSDRLRALMLAGELKSRIVDGSFRMAQPVERIS